VLSHPILLRAIFTFVAEPQLNVKMDVNVLMTPRLSQVVVIFVNSKDPTFICGQFHKIF